MSVAGGVKAVERGKKWERCKAREKSRSGAKRGKKVIDSGSKCWKKSGRGVQRGKCGEPVHECFVCVADWPRESMFVKM